MDNNSRGNATADKAATSAIYDLIKNHPQGEFFEMGVNVSEDYFGARPFKYSRGISGRPTGIDPTQWAKVAPHPLNPANWFKRNITMLHTQPAIGPQSLTVSGGPKSKNPGTGDVDVARTRFGKTGQYMFSYQDEKLRYFDGDGREVRVVHEMPNWRPR